MNQYSLTTVHISRNHEEEVVQGINPFAHPYYLQDKGNVERVIRNLNQEFVCHLRRLPEWLNGKIEEFMECYNNSRFHREINDLPARLYHGVKLET